MTGTPGLVRIVEEGNLLRTRLEKPPEAMIYLRVLLPEFPIERGDRTQREQPDHGAHLQTLGPAVRQPEHVVEEPVVLVPHPGVLASVHHRGGDPQEVLDELETHLPIAWPLQRQLHGNL